MGKFGASTPKRQLGWSNDYDFIDGLVRSGGFLSAAEKQQLADVKLAVTHTNKHGKSVYTGVKKKLKESQLLISISAECLQFLMPGSVDGF